ncbi:hypothetical protein CLOM_g2860 [Closterium sp. NIES-68]|nr:hypothetical protein CLOM_g2860 [Closterium sp. NIES-68]
MAPSSGGKGEAGKGEHGERTAGARGEGRSGLAGPAGGGGRGPGGGGSGSGGAITPGMTEKQLQARWERIEEALGELPEDDEAEEKLMALKGKWFTDAFSFLSSLPPASHLWCRHRTLTQPLLEPFYHYLSGPPETRATLHALWQRMAKEMRACTRCVARYHAAKRVYEEEYVEEVVGPVLKTLRRLDEERVGGDGTAGSAAGASGGGSGAGGAGGAGNGDRGGQALDAERDGPGVICLMFELLMYPYLLEDAEVFALAGPALVLVERHFDLSLTPGQRYPGLYYLMLHPSKDTRAIVYTLAKPLGLFKTAADLRPIDPLLQQCMHALEYDLFDTGIGAGTDTFGGTGTGPGAGAGLGRASAAVNANPSAHGGGGEREGRERPRVVHTKEDMWQGLLTILSLMAPPALDEGVVERYPAFVSIVLNHVGEDTSVFRPALACLRMMLQVTGYKLWLHSAFPPGVVRNTLISQCFNSTHEPTHKLLLDLLPPFLQSVESLETEEFERQRRSILFFLLIQLPNSRNFSTTTIKIARRVAFHLDRLSPHPALLPALPASPPTDCADIWGPPLVGAVKDASLPDPLRLPAVHLAQAILTADAAALTSLALSRAFAGASARGLVSGSDLGPACVPSVFSRALVCPGDAEGGGEGGEGGGGGGGDCRGGDGVVAGGVDASSTGQSCTSSSSSSSSSSISEGLPQDQLDRLAELAAAESDRWQCAPALWVELLERTPPQWLPKPLLRAAVWVAGHFCLSASAAAAAAAVTSAGSKPLVTSSLAVTSSAVVTAALHWRLAPGAGGGGRGAKAGCVNAVVAAAHEEELSVILQRSVSSCLVQIRGANRLKLLTWHASLAEPLIFLLVDSQLPNRDMARELLTSLCRDHRIDHQLAFLASSPASARGLVRAFAKAAAVVRNG